MGANQRRLDMLEKRARDAFTDKAVREAMWNARHAANRHLWFYPTIGAGDAAECPWLRFYCPACRQIGEVDLRKLDRHRGATIESHSGVVLPALPTRSAVRKVVRPRKAP